MRTSRVKVYTARVTVCTSGVKVYTGRATVRTIGVKVYTSRTIVMTIGIKGSTIYWSLRRILRPFNKADQKRVSTYI